MTMTRRIRFVTILPFWLVVVLLLAHGRNVYALDDEEAGDEFFQACSAGNTEYVTAMIQVHTDWIHSRTMDGETCLHLAAVPKDTSLTQVLLEAGANPNVRTTALKDMRMHPLAWNVYQGRPKNVMLLLEHGAEVNADVDAFFDAINHPMVTALDIVNQLLSLPPDELDDKTIVNRWIRIRTILKKHGARTYEEQQEQWVLDVEL